MREIKFRVWDKLYKVMREVLSIDLEKKKVICPPRGHEFSEWYNQHLSFNEVLPLQYTGLKDKNGKEIYEGDIFRTYLRHVAVVEWSNDGRFLGFTAERDIIYVDMVPAIEVIGNIYENPELLEEGK